MLTWISDEERSPYVDTQLHPTMRIKNHNQSVATNIKYMPPKQAHKSLGHTKQMDKNMIKLLYFRLSKLKPYSFTPIFSLRTNQKHTIHPFFFQGWIFYLDS